MADTAQDFGTLMRRVREGSQEAAEELFERYGPHIRRVVRRSLNKRLRSQFDSSDFVQAVWATFFTVHVPESIDRPEALIAFLANLARNKVVEAFRQRFQSMKYNVNREHSLEGSAAYQVIALPAPQPTPSQAFLAKEEWDKLLERVPAQHRRILDLVRQGSTHKEIAQELGLNEKTIRRLIRKLALRSRAHDEPTEPCSAEVPAHDSAAE